MGNKTLEHLLMKGGRLLMAVFLFISTFFAEGNMLKVYAEDSHEITYHVTVQETSAPYVNGTKWTGDKTVTLNNGVKVLDFSGNIKDTETFVGWFLDSDFKRKYSGTTSAADAAKLTLYGYVSSTVKNAEVVFKDDSGRPVKGAEVNLFLASEDAKTTGEKYPEQTVTTDATGKAELAMAGGTDYVIRYGALPKISDSQYYYVSDLETVGGTIPSGYAGNDKVAVNAEDTETEITVNWTLSIGECVTVKFDLNGGSTAQPDAYKDRQMTVYDMVSAPANPNPPTASGKKYVFDSWYAKTKTGEEFKWDFTKVIASSSTAGVTGNYASESAVPNPITLKAKYVDAESAIVHVSFQDVDENKTAATQSEIDHYAFDVNVYPGIAEWADFTEVIRSKLNDLGQDGYAAEGAYPTKAKANKTGSSLNFVFDQEAFNGTGSDNQYSIKISVIHQREETVNQDSRPVIRTIVFNQPGGKTTQEQTANITTKLTTETDKVTGKTSVTTMQEIDDGWTAVTPPAVEGYTAYPSIVPAVYAHPLDPDEVIENTEVQVSYVDEAMIPVTVRIEGNSEEFTYDASTHSVEGYTVTEIEDESGTYTEADIVFAGTAKADGKDAGIYFEGLRASDFSNSREGYIVTFAVKDGKLTINRRDAQVSANASSKPYGEADPEYTAEVSGVLDGDTLSYKLARTPGEHVGVYPLLAVGRFFQGNYSVSYESNLFTIESIDRPSPEPEPEEPPAPIEDPTDEGAKSSHADITDFDQTVVFPGIQTTLGLTEEDEETYYLDDIVHYRNVTANHPYIMSGELHLRVEDGTDAGIMKDAEGNDITGETAFTPAGSEGDVTVRFIIPKRVLKADYDVVAFERLYDGTVVSEEARIARHEDIEDMDQSWRPIAIRTTATNAEGEKTVMPGTSVTILDEVKYSGLVAGKSYEMKGTLNLVSADGSSVDKELAAKSRPFTAEAESGSVILEFVIDASDLSTRKIVAFEELYQGSIRLAVHADINDEAQTVTVKDRDMKTTAVDTNTGEKEIRINTEAVEQNISLTDTVAYTGLKPGQEYEMTGTVHVNDNGTDAGPLMVDGAPVTASMKFTPNASSGTVEMVFTFDGRAISSDTQLVVFEDMKQNGISLIVHADINDADQTVTVRKYAQDIELKTTATGADGAAKEIEAAKNAVIKDVVTYSGLQVGVTYEMRGEVHLVNQDGTDGGVIASMTQEFTPETADGTMSVVFSDVDISMLEDRSLVVFESLYLNGTLIKKHEDLNDQGQTVTVRGKVPSIGTTATGDAGGKTVKPSKETVVIDTVSYRNLIPGVEYILRGTLQLVNESGTGSEAVASQILTFTPETESGTVSVTFKVDTENLENRKLVVFEDLYRGEDVVATHSDLNDEGQTVIVQKEIPAIKTTATNENGGKTVKPEEKVKIVDTVTYQNLKPGTEYTLAGTLHLVGNDGKDEKTLAKENVTFKPEQANGSIQVIFTVDARDLEGRSLVVFEDLIQQGVTIAMHADITDQGQTVKVEENSPTPTPEPTPEPSRPGIHTMAYNLEDGYDTVYPNQSVTVNDIVYYSGLTPYVEYVLEGSLHIKNPDGTDGGVLYSNGSPVTASKRFTPVNAEGATELSFTFDASALNGTVCVAFEQLYLGSDHTFLESHKDITDDDQTIWIDRNPKRRRKRIRWIRTDAGRDTVIYGGIGLTALVCLAALLVKWRKQKN